MNLSFVKKISLLLAAVITVSSLSACAGLSSKYDTLSYSALGTVTNINLSLDSENGGDHTEEYLASVSQRCSDILSRLDYKLSSHNGDSEVYYLSQDIDILVSDDKTLFDLLDTAHKISVITEGAYDCTSGTLSEIWDFNGEGRIPTSDEIASALAHVGYDKFEISENTIKKLDKNAKIDFELIERGFAAQQLLEYLSETDIKYGTVSVGNTVGVFGEKKNSEVFKLGITSPDGDILGNLFISSGFVSTVSDRDEFFEKEGTVYHNIIDPRTGYPADSGLRGVTVYAANGPTSSALARALFVMGADESLALYESGKITFEAIFVTESGEIITTPGITSSMFEVTSENYSISSVDE